MYTNILYFAYKVKRFIEYFLVIHAYLFRFQLIFVDILHPARIFINYLCIFYVLLITWF